MKDFLKTKKGITLIALVITIVILIILAGVLINLSLGDNGLFARVRQASKKYQDAQEQERIASGKFRE